VLRAVAAFTGDWSSGSFVRDPIIDVLMFAATCMNGRFSRCPAVCNFSPLRKNLRCLRAQRNFDRSGVGSKPSFAARCLSDRFAGQSELSLQML